MSEQLTVGSLFSGADGLGMALEMQGHHIIWQCEIDKYASQVLRTQWPGIPNLGDITTIDWGWVERPDILCGGFPCQDLSYAGKGAGLSGTRSALWNEFARAIRDLRPRHVFVENVAALRTRGLEVVIADLAALGYVGSWSCLPASAAGAPHKRDRMFIVATDSTLEHVDRAG